MDEYLFYGIKAHQEMYLERRKPKEEAYILKKILETGFIASRKYLKEILSKNEYEFMEQFCVMNWNDMDNVSITSSLKSNIIYGRSLLGIYSDIEENSTTFSYNHYIRKFPSIILNPLLLTELSMRPEPYRKHIGEVQIVDKIPMEYFVGIALPNINLNSFLSRVIDSFDILNVFENEIKLDFIDISEEEFVQKYYQDVIIFENVLHEMGFNLKLYHTESGEEILSSNDEIEYIRDLKRKIRH